MEQKQLALFEAEVGLWLRDHDGAQKVIQHLARVGRQSDAFAVEVAAGQRVWLLTVAGQLLGVVPIDQTRTVEQFCLDLSQVIPCDPAQIQISELSCFASASVPTRQPEAPPEDVALDPSA